VTAAARTDLSGLLSSLVRDVPDFPEPGIIFKDISPLLADHSAFTAVVDALADVGRDSAGAPVVDKVAGVEARGFILAAPVALALGAGFVPVRKAGKLPGAVYSQSCVLEYGEAILEIHQHAFAPGDRVLLVDDVLATGGTLEASAELVRRSGAVVHAIAVLIELSFLGGAERVAGHSLSALLRV